MLIKITNTCGAGCSHCMEDSKPRTGQHMPWELFIKALDFTARVEEGVPVVMALISGGECTEHPKFLEMLGEVETRGMHPVIITNGYWLGGPLQQEILRPGRDLTVQVTHDSRFYPGPPPPRVQDTRITYVEQLSLLLPLGRMGRRPGEADKGVALRRAPTSFNMRSMIRSGMSFYGAVRMARMRYLTGLSQQGLCSPSVDHEGVVHIGESRFCYEVGTVDSTDQELTQAVRTMGACNRCRLEEGLGPRERAALGL